MMKKHTIYLTKQCNCRCKYCYQDNFDKIYLWEDIKKQLDYIIKNKYKVVEFIGGEPFLVFDLLKKCYNYLNSVNKDITYYISTNGTIINKNIIEFIKEHDNIYLFISLDGNEEMNKLRIDKNNNETFNIVVNNIKKLIDNGLQKRLIVHMVLHNYNVSCLFEGIIFLQKLGILNIDIGIIEKTQKINKQFCIDFINQHLKISKNIKKKNIKINIFTLMYEPNITIQNKFDEINQFIRNIVYKNHLLIMRGDNFNYESRIK